MSSKRLRSTWLPDLRDSMPSIEMNITYKHDWLRRLATEESYRAKFSREVVAMFRQRVAEFDAVADERNFHTIHGLGFEKLEKELTGKYAIRINRQFRIIFEIRKSTAGNTIHIVDVRDYH